MPGPYDDRGRGVGRELTEQRLPVGVSLRGSLVVVLDLGEVEGDVRRDVDRPGIARVDVAKSIGGAGIRPSPAALVYFPGRRRMAHLLYHPAWLPRFPAGRPSDRCRVQRIASMSTPDQNCGGRRPHGARANDAAPRARRRLLTGGGAHRTKSVDAPRPPRLIGLPDRLCRVLPGGPAGCAARNASSDDDPAGALDRVEGALAAGLGMAVKNATLLLDDFCAAGIAIEVTHRSKRRLFGLTGLAPLRDVVRPPYRPEQGRGRGRPPLVAEEAITLPALPPVPPLDRQPFDYSDLAHWMTQMDQTIRQARRTLSAAAPSTRQDTDVASDPLGTRLANSPADPQSVPCACLGCANGGASRGPIPVGNPLGVFAGNQLDPMDHLGARQFLFVGCSQADGACSWSVS